MLAAGGGAYESDEDPQLVRDALPFGLKLIESLLAESPRHKGLLLAACQGFTLYGYAYVQQEADRIGEVDLERGEQVRDRARRLYLRASQYGLRALELAYPGIGRKLETTAREALAAVRKKRDVPLLYWNAAALGLAVSASRSDAEMLARLPEVEALLERALDLDESWNEGALHEFQVVYVSTRPGAAAPDIGRIKRHYARALELSAGKRAGLYVAYAEAVSVRTQDRAEFRATLEKALAIAPDRHKEVRLLNLIAQRRARWLLGRTDELFLEEEAAPLGRAEKQQP